MVNEPTRPETARQLDQFVLECIQKRRGVASVAEKAYALGAADARREIAEGVKAFAADVEVHGLSAHWVINRVLALVRQAAPGQGKEERSWVEDQRNM
jgi:hypothetical protein